MLGREKEGGEGHSGDTVGKQAMRKEMEGRWWRYTLCWVERRREGRNISRDTVGKQTMRNEMEGRWWRYTLCWVERRREGRNIREIL